MTSTSGDVVGAIVGNPLRTATAEHKAAKLPFDGS